MSYISDLRARLDSIVEERATLKEEADALTVDETRDAAAVDARADEIIARLAVLKTEKEAAEARLAELESVEERRENAKRAPIIGINKVGDIRDARALSNEEARGAALTFVEKSRHFIRDDHKENVTKLIERGGSRVGAGVARMVLTTGNDDYCSAFTKYMSGDVNGFGMSQAERSALALGKDFTTPEERANMTSGTGSSGGYFVPVFVDPTMIVTGAGSTNPFRHISTVKNIGPAFGGWYGATAAQVTAAWTAEGSAAPDNTPTVSQVNIPVYMAEAQVQVSYQAYEDISDLASDVSTLFIDAKNNLEAAAHTTGSGSSQPTGIVTAIGAVTASRISPTTGGTLSFQDPTLLMNALPERFATYDWNNEAGTSVAFTASATIANKLRTLLIAQNSANSGWTDLGGGQPPLLIGQPIYRSGSMSTSLTTGQDVLLYGDFSRFYIIDRVGFSVEFVPNYFDTSTGRPTAVRGWMAHWRTGSNAVDTNAFRLLRL